MHNKITVKLKKAVSLLLAFTFLFSFSLGMSLEADANVVIKTQQKANSLFSNGAIKGIDVSKWQGSINWPHVASDGVKYAFIRSNYGAETDPTFVTNATQAKSNGIRVGAYHYSRFKSDKTMREEADAFLKQLQKVEIDYPVVLDVENHYGLSKSQLTKLCLDFIKIIESKGYKVMLYTYQNFMDGHLNLSTLTNNGVDIWIANYKDYPDAIPHQIWQHTSYGKVNGIKGRVDINVCYKDLTVRKYIENLDLGLATGITSKLNEVLECSMNPEKLTYDETKYWLSYALQRELAHYYDQTIEANGALTDNEVDILLHLNAADPNNANILSFIQAQLFYLGYYNTDTSGAFDGNMTQAVKDFQENNSIEATGTLNRTTLNKLFSI